MKTIFAPATAPGKAGVAIIRISGPDAKRTLELFCPHKQIIPRYATFTTLIAPDSSPLDDALVLYFPAPHSFTGEDVVEFHTHGSHAVIASVMEHLSQLPGLTLAAPGEFSRRAFLNGKMDLTEAEGLADLIEAETSIQQQQALRQMRGELHQLYGAWRQEIISLLANIEAYIDFPDEELPASLRDTITGQVAQFKHRLHGHLNDNRRGEKLRHGLYAVILGAPNAGKSSLINILAKRDIAIVSHIAGTTRDVIEVHLDIHGYPMVVADTAGLRETEEVIEEEGIKRARARAGEADVKLAVFDASLLPQLDPHTLAMIDDNTLVILNKTDLLPTGIALPATLQGRPFIPLSLEKKTGVDALLEALHQWAASHLHLSGDPVITRTRHRQHVSEALSHLSRFSLDMPIELAAEDLRMAARALGKITGHIDIEDILDEIFSSFCIGK